MLLGETGDAGYCEREGSREMSACHTGARAHTPGLGTVCGSKCERACAAVRVRVCLGV